MDIERPLIESGLLEREVKMYLALLELGESGVLPIAKRAGIERTYGYDILESLLKKGLVTSVEKNGKRMFSAQDPVALERMLEQRLQGFKQVLPELRALYNTESLKPTVRFIEGKESLHHLYSELAESLCYDAIAGPSVMYNQFGSLFNDIAMRLASRKARVRELVTSVSGIPEYAAYFQVPLQEVRMLPDSVQVTTDTLIYEDKVVSISYTPIIHAVITEGSGIVGTQRALFDYMWDATRPLA